MLIVITPEIDVADETNYVNDLFQLGLVCLHIRKPNKNIDEMRNYLDKIDIQYRNKIVIHSFHELAKEYELKGVHFSEKKRQQTLDFGNLYIAYSKHGFTVSSSYHKIDDLNSNEQLDYVFLSPVFDSISKSNYSGKHFNVLGYNQTIIGLGGIKVENINSLNKLGYKGAAVLGTIWMSSNPVKVFNNLQNSYQLELVK